MFSKKRPKGLEQKYRELAQKMQETEVEGQSAAGLVKVRINGRMELVEILLSPECVDPEEVTLLQDLILSAFKKAQEQLESQLPSF